jgi:hypothetical protein
MHLLRLSFQTCAFTADASSRFDVSDIPQRCVAHSKFFPLVGQLYKAITYFHAAFITRFFILYYMDHVKRSQQEIVLETKDEDMDATLACSASGSSII